VLVIKELADKVAEHVFTDFGTFMLDRTVKSFTETHERSETAKSIELEGRPTPGSRSTIH
jgi:hypothetical protein